MIKYIALLRGINVGGKNKIEMPQLKTAFQKQGFENVVTYINSGNVIFESPLNEVEVKAACESLIQVNCGLTISVCIIPAAELADALAHAPIWWNKEADAKHNAVFVIPPMKAEEIYAEISEGKPEVEKIAFHGRVMFWSAPSATFSNTRLTKIVHKKDYNAITVRNANTALKLAEF